MENIKDRLQQTSFVQDPMHTMGLDQWGFDGFEKDGNRTKQGRFEERETTTGKQRGQLLHGNTHDGDGNGGGNVGVFDGKLGQGFKLQVGTLKSDFGKMKDGEGNTEYGVNLEGNSVKVERDFSKKVPLKFHGDGPGGNFVAKCNKKGVTLNVGYNLVGGGGQVGNENNNVGFHGGLGGGVNFELNTKKNKNGKSVFHTSVGVGPGQVEINSRLLNNLGVKGKKLVGKGTDWLKDELEKTEVGQKVVEGGEKLLEGGEKLVNKGIKLVGKGVEKGVDKGVKGVKKGFKNLKKMFDDTEDA